MSEGPDLSIIVVSYGTREMTLRCLDSIVLCTHAASYETIVVDNGSTDGSAKAIADRFPSFRVIALPDNRGFGAACNLAAHDATGSYVLLVNPDTVIRDGAIDALLAFARRTPEAGIWGGRTVFESGALNPFSCWRGPSLWNHFCAGLALNTRFPRSALFNSLGYGGWERDSERAVDIVSGCFLLIRKDIWDRLHGFAPEFFMYGEDTDLCLRARKIGFRPHVTPEATIVHEGSGTETDTKRKIRQVLAARVLLARRHFSPLARPFALTLIALRPMIGRAMAKKSLRPLWREIWAVRGDWMAGRY